MVTDLVYISQQQIESMESYGFVSTWKAVIPDPNVIIFLLSTWCGEWYRTKFYILCAERRTKGWSLKIEIWIQPQKNIVYNKTYLSDVSWQQWTSGSQNCSYKTNNDLDFGFHFYVLTIFAVESLVCRLRNVIFLNVVTKQQHSKLQFNGVKWAISRLRKQLLVQVDNCTVIRKLRNVF